MARPTSRRNCARRGITAVWIGGTSTNTCCEATARDAMLLISGTTMVSDANADHTDAEHNATLINFCINFATSPRPTIWWRGCEGVHRRGAVSRRRTVD